MQLDGYVLCEEGNFGKRFSSYAVLATLGTAAFAYALTDPLCRHKLEDYADKIRNFKDKVCKRSSAINDTEKA